MGLLTIGVYVILILLPDLETLVLLLGCLDMRSFYLLLVYLVLSCLAVFSWMPALF